MPVYKAPLRDMKFLLNEVFDYPGHYEALASGGNATPDIVDAILTECGRFCEEVLSPLYQSGDDEGCKLEDGIVTTPRGYKEAYVQYAMGGWQGLSAPEEFGGQGLPASMGLLKQEMMGTANWSFSMYPGLSLGAMNTIFLHGSATQKHTYLTPLTEGRWGGTMCLTEPQCGTDLGQVKTRAEPQADGSYRLTGTKIFISSGDHDLTENIVHIVLARLPDAPKGTRGISLFIVPKFLPTEEGGVGERNAVTCGSLEKKMGIKASATCVMNFDGATGFLIGPENEGLNCMFTFMNTARIGTAIQGVGPAELSYQWALAYARERRSMRALSGKKEPDQIADALIYHADVRRMLLTQKAIAEGGRAMLYYAARLADHMVEGHTAGDQKKAEKYDDKLGFLTPILKGFLTELGCEAANLGMQVFGGHGYIREHGMEQIVRDTRIATLYEGTTGIQALDLLGRKVLLMTQGGAVRDFTLKIANFARKHLTDKRLRPYAVELLKLSAQWNLLTVRVMLAARKDRDVVSAAANDFLMYSGYVTMAYIWARQAAVAADRVRKGGEESEAFYRAKLATAEFYYERLLPRAQAHATSMLSPTENLMQLDAEDMAFIG
ncbi:acyl-CoA dehydrogenase C-terminal domain-containing protein [Marinobacter sp. M216]|uniref:Acyl-CoA dehydrogenase C-terminal domain-containing protein n=1 Tax=Marinobacter albus TaxID=3030833 RepID=A0ABT7HD70_9GAMM|nr:acyl-CoA dehydrogenase C-terminal domain-containing protein [Marinobacter sp. M216]MDK9558313.1 acyl-CoA dehydrogenase C-terminal domain-containing protein [Marinobacter sp. M216]